MAEEADNRNSSDKVEKLIEKALDRQWTEIFTKFSEIIMRFTSISRESSERPHSNKIIPFKVKMNMDIPNIEGKIDVELVDNWVQQLESCDSVNQLSEVEKITIASLKMSNSVQCRWENLSTKMEK